MQLRWNRALRPGKFYTDWRMEEEEKDEETLLVTHVRVHREERILVDDLGFVREVLGRTMLQQ